MSDRISARFVELYAEICEEEAARLQGPEVAGARDFFDNEMSNVRRAFRGGEELERTAPSGASTDSAVARIADALFVYYDVEGTLRTWVPFGVAGRASADRAQRRVALCSLHNKLGVAHRMLGDLATARDCYRLAEADAVDAPSVADCHTNLADLDRLDGRIDDALRHARTARESAEGDLNRTAKTYEYEGLAELARFDVDAAVACYGQAMSAREEAGNLVKVAFVHTLLGFALTIRGRPTDLEAARGHYRSSFVLDQEIRAHQALARFRGDYASTLLALGKPEQALNSARQALIENRNVEFRRGEALNLARMACALHQLGRRDEAAETAAAAFGMVDVLTDFDRRMIGAVLAVLEDNYGPATARPAAPDPC